MAMTEARFEDREMLEALIKSEDSLVEGEGAKFAGMLSAVERGKGRLRLSGRQREYVEQRFKDLELDAEVSLNLHSSGKLAQGPVRKSGSTKILGNVPNHALHPLHPPNKRCTSSACSLCSGNRTGHFA